MSNQKIFQEIAKAMKRLEARIVAIEETVRKLQAEKAK
jgi:hypothetical protein